jgi:hypothetical protein
MNNIILDYDDKNILIALDSTAIICFISELTNNITFLDLNYCSNSLIDQSKKEIHHRALTELNLINNSNNIIICQAVIDEMKPILDNLAGPNEVERATILYSRSRIIPNYPLSERISSLKLTKRIQDRTKIVFGIILLVIYNLNILLIYTIFLLRYC